MVVPARMAPTFAEFRDTGSAVQCLRPGKASTVRQFGIGFLDVSSFTFTGVGPTAGSIFVFFRPPRRFKWSFT